MLAGKIYTSGDVKEEVFRIKLVQVALTYMFCTLGLEPIFLF